MDPYLILKIRRDCTRTEVKEVFRAKVQLDHPDHGGDKKQFIKICTAYRMVLSDLDARAKIESSWQSADGANCSGSTASRSGDDPYVKLLQRVSARSNARESKRRPRPANVPGSHSRRPADVPGSHSQMSHGAILGGLLALGFFLAEVVASVLDYDRGPIRAATNQIDPARLTPARRGDAEPQGQTATRQIDPGRLTRARPGAAEPDGQTESIGIGLEADQDHASAADFHSLPWVQLDRLP
jgi:curved DNA-binding protein CbpA